MRGEESGRAGIADCEAGVRTGFAMTQYKGYGGHGVQEKGGHNVSALGHFVVAISVRQILISHQSQGI